MLHARNRLFDVELTVDGLLSWTRKTIGGLQNLRTNGERKTWLFIPHPTAFPYGNGI